MGGNWIGLIIGAIVIGLIIVAFLGVSTTKRPCPVCHTMMPVKKTLCPRCGRAIPIHY